MAITATTSQRYPRGWIVNGNSADLSGTEELKAAVVGESHYLQKVMISSNTAITYTIGAGETAGAVTTVIIGPIYTAANSNQTFEFAKPIKLAAATALVVDASGAGAATIVVEGYTE